MKQSVKATSIIESMIVLLVVVTGITGVYWLLISSQSLANSTSQRIEAIQIARDGIESITSIRDTNWIMYAADYQNCWNVFNYNNTCIWNTGTALDINHNTNEALTVSRDSNNKFILTKVSYPWGISSYSSEDYRNDFAVQKDSRWFYTQSGGTLYWESTPYYTREIQVDYIDSSGAFVWPLASNNASIQVRSIVQWNDSANSRIQSLEMKTILTNWKGEK